ncbi:MAG: acetyl-CoA C-acyltransferase [Anaerolineae bacterium]|nr:acetyl-CoA C-acyltransferase [Anaerolineae bacterium]
MQNGTSAQDAVILSAARTPQGRFLGALSSLSAAELGRIAYRAALDRSGIDPFDLSEIIVGNVVSAGVGQALPRQISIGAGMPEQIGGLAINKVCGSGLKTAMLASSAIRAGDGEAYLVGGVESMSNAPFLVDGHRQGHKYGHSTLRDSLQSDGLWCSLCDWGMGNAAEFIARQLEIQRADMDLFAYESHMKALAATRAGKFRAEIVPVTVPTRKGAIIIEDDEPIRAETTVESLASLKPAFEDDGRVTAGNAPGMNDGAAALVVTSQAYAERAGKQPLARIVSYGQAAVEPAWIFYAPVKAIPIALAKAGWTVDDVDLFEINEAFAAQVLADVKGLGREGHAIPAEKLNVHGGAIALGHPLGASGARVLITLVHALRDRGMKRGVAALCLGGAEAVAMCVEVM